MRHRYQVIEISTGRVLSFAQTLRSAVDRAKILEEDARILFEGQEKARVVGGKVLVPRIRPSSDSPEESRV